MIAAKLEELKKYMPIVSKYVEDRLKHFSSLGYIDPVSNNWSEYPNANLGKLLDYANKPIDDDGWVRNPQHMFEHIDFSDNDIEFARFFRKVLKIEPEWEIIHHRGSRVRSVVSGYNAEHPDRINKWFSQ